MAPRTILSAHQQDVYAREAAMEQEDVRRQAGRQIKILTTRTHAQDLQKSFRKMEKELRELPKSPPRPRIRQTAQELLPVVNIAQISATGFHFNLYRPENEVFQTSLYEIDKILAEREELRGPRTGSSLETTETEEQLVERLLPVYLRRHRDVFSKTASDTLPLYHLYDYSI